MMKAKKEVKGEEKPKHVHNYVEDVSKRVEPTCVSTGTAYYVCKGSEEFGNCDNKSYSETLPINPNNHINSMIKETEGEVFYENGKMYTRIHRVCEACGAILEDGKEECTIYHEDTELNLHNYTIKFYDSWNEEYCKDSDSKLITVSLVSTTTLSQIVMSAITVNGLSEEFVPDYGNDTVLVDGNNTAIFNGRFIRDGKTVITSQVGLNKVDTDAVTLGGNYILDADLNRTSAFGKLTGTFDGNNHLIQFNSSDLNKVNQGLFSEVDSNGVVENLKVSTMGITGKSNVGGIAGSNKGTIENCSVVGAVKAASADDANVGGIVGYNMYGGKTVKCNYAGDVYSLNGGDNVGGIVGINSFIVSYCNMTSGNVYGDTIITSNNEQISSYKGANRVGGIVGQNSYDGDSNIIRDDILEDLVDFGKFIGILCDEYVLETKEAPFIFHCSTKATNIVGSNAIGGICGVNGGGEIEQSFAEVKNIIGSSKLYITYSDYMTSDWTLEGESSFSFFHSNYSDIELIDTKKEKPLLKTYTYYKYRYREIEKTELSSNNSDNVGGICGKTDKGILYNCYVKAEKIVGGDCVNGVTKLLSTGKVINCYCYIDSFIFEPNTLTKVSSGVYFDNGFGTSSEVYSYCGNLPKQGDIVNYIPYVSIDKNQHRCDSASNLLSRTSNSKDWNNAYCWDFSSTLPRLKGFEY